MPKNVRINWDGGELRDLDQQVLIVTDDPLAGGRSVWFEDYMDYKAHFAMLYRQAKELSTGWTNPPEFAEVEVEGIPLLESLEHQILSFWLQILRDRMLIHNLIVKEKPSTLELAGKGLDYNKMSECKFDPGLFGVSARHVAEKMDVKVIGLSACGDTDIPRRGYGYLFTVGVADQLKCLFRPRRKYELPILLVSNHARLKLGPAFLEKTRKFGVNFIGTDIDNVPEMDTVYSLAGHKVAALQRLKILKNLYQNFERISLKTWDSIFSVEGDNYGAIARRLVRNCLYKYGWGESYRTVLMGKFLKSCVPNVLLVLYDHGISEAGIVALAKSKGIKTITVQHGLVCSQIPGYLPVKSNFFACWGERERETLTSQGADPEKLAVIGFPGFDELWTKRMDTLLEPAKPLRVLIATQGVESSVEWYFALTPTARIIKAITEMNYDRESVQFTIRLHPNEELSLQALELANKAGIKVTKRLPLYGQFDQCDVVVTQFSTVGLEALLYGKPLVSLNWVSAEEVTPYAKEGVAERSCSPKDFLPSLSKAVSGHGQKRSDIEAFLTKHLTDNRASERLTQLCTPATLGDSALSLPLLKV
jgi:hypothetical protein